jgi:tRNA(adenine34) deaminase
MTGQPGPATGATSGEAATGATSPGAADGGALDRPTRLVEPRGPSRDLAAMRLALAEAELAGAAGDVPVGAVVVGLDGTILGRGHNIREATGDPTGHAEIVALRAAAREVGEWRLTGATLVVTLEPCTMCAGALVLARVARLVYGAYDDKAGAVGSLWDVVRDRRLNHRPEVIPGVAGADCTAVLNAFFATRRGAPPAPGRGA